MLLELAFHQPFCLKFSFRLVTFSKSYARKQKWMFLSEHSVKMWGAYSPQIINIWNVAHKFSPEGLIVCMIFT